MILNARDGECLRGCWSGSTVVLFRDGFEESLFSLIHLFSRFIIADRVGGCNPSEAAGRLATKGLLGYSRRLWTCLLTTKQVLFHDLYRWH
jgi:hypothetical protein